MIETLAFVSVVATCSWENPGSNRYTQNPIAALNSYDLTLDQKAELTSKMTSHKYDDVVDIKKETISGKSEYENLRAMHFGKGSVCGAPDRSKWGDRTERGLVYCAKDVCVVVPTICNNVSLISRIKSTGSGSVAGGASGNLGISYTSISTEPNPMTSLVIYADAEKPVSFGSVSEERYYSSATLAMVPVINYSPNFGAYFPPSNPTPVPETKTWLMLVVGLAFLYKVKQKTS